MVWRMNPDAGANADWPKIIEVARAAGQKLGNGTKPGQRTRMAYLLSYQKARALGYHGDERDWQIFVRRHG
jgi:hypothetical protein